MSLGSICGANAMGHYGWITVRCRICGKWLNTTKDEVYICPKDKDRYGAYYCAACAKVLHYKCPYCDTELELL